MSRRIIVLGDYRLDWDVKVGKSEWNCGNKWGK